MPGPPKTFWKAHVLNDTWTYQKEPPRISVLLKIDEPDRFEGRIVEVTFTHQVPLADFVEKAGKILLSKGRYLRNKMG